MKIFAAGWLTRNERIACTGSTRLGSPSTTTASGAPPATAHAPRSTSAKAAARAHLGAEAAPRLGRHVPGRDRLDARGAPERLLGDVHARAVVGGEEDDAGRIGQRLLMDPLDRLDGAAARRRQAAARAGRHRPDQDEFADGDGTPVVDQPLLLERVLGRRCVRQRGVDLAVAHGFQHRQRGTRHQQHGDPGIGAERVLQAARQPGLDERHVDAHSQRPGPSGRTLGARRPAQHRRSRGGDDEGTAAQHRTIIAGAPATAGRPGCATPGLHWRNAKKAHAPSPARPPDPVAEGA